MVKINVDNFIQFILRAEADMNIFVAVVYWGWSEVADIEQDIPEVKITQTSDPGCRRSCYSMKIYKAEFNGIDIPDKTYYDFKSLPPTFYFISPDTIVLRQYI